MPLKSFYLLVFTAVLIVGIQAQGQSGLSSISGDSFESLPFKGLEGVLRAKPTNDRTYLDFVGSGDIQKSVSQGDNISANTGLGVIFERFRGFEQLIQSFELEGTINIASTSDSIIAEFDNNGLANRRDFGAYVLNPVSVNQSLFLNSNVYFGYPDETIFAEVARWVSGINIRAITSNNVWSYNDSIANLGALYFRIGLFHEFIPDNFRVKDDETEFGRSKYSIFFGLNYSYRGIIGDITADNNKELMQKVLGSTEKNFGGFEANFGFKLNNLRAEFQMPILVKENSISGLTNTQFIFSIKFIGGFPLRLTKVSDDNKSKLL
ncbi:MAG: hypothetical protein AAF632_20725 [Bacteroidota bacterium]